LQDVTQLGKHAKCCCSTGSRTDATEELKICSCEQEQVLAVVMWTGLVQPLFELLLQHQHVVAGLQESLPLLQHQHAVAGLQENVLGIRRLGNEHGLILGRLRTKVPLRQHHWAC